MHREREREKGKEREKERESSVHCILAEHGYNIHIRAYVYLDCPKQRRYY